MDCRVETIKEAWIFLINEVYANGGFDGRDHGEFRIHSNKNGIRLYLEFKNTKFTGEVFRYYTGLGFNFHRSLRKIIPKTYCGSVVSSTLVKALNMHLDKMPGDILHDDIYVIKHGTDMSDIMSWQEFLLEDLRQRGQESRYEIEVTRCKELYNL